MSQSNSNNTKINLESNVGNSRNLIAAIGGIRGNNEPRLDKALKCLEELEDWVTAKAFAMGSYVFCSNTEVANWITSQEVPTTGVFWDIFSVVV